MKTSNKHQWTLAAFVMVSGCQLGVEQLEAGDTLDSFDDTGTGATEGPNGTGDESSDACVSQGTNLGGGPEPIDFPVPECEVECATGWGHGAAPLASAWTFDLEHDGPTTGWTHLGLLPGGDVVAFIGNASAPARLVLISPAGELLDDVVQPEITGDVWDMSVDQSGTIYALWHDDERQLLSATTPAGEPMWTVELGPYQQYASVLAPLSSGVVVALNAADEFGTNQLLHVDETGAIVHTGPIPLTWEIAVSPSGDSIVLANNTSITWADSYPEFPSGLMTQGVADVWATLGLVALDDERAVSVGASNNWDEDGLPNGFIKQIGPTGLEWEDRYDRAVSWCSDESPSDEVFVDVARLADGSLLVVGGEGLGVDGPDVGQVGAEQFQQPWVGHVSADGEVLATDRGFWRGQAAAAVGAADGSAYVLMYEFDANDQQRLHVRKYLP